MNELAKYIDFGQGVANPGYIWNIKDVMKRAEAGGEAHDRIYRWFDNTGKPVIHTAEMLCISCV